MNFHHLLYNVTNSIAYVTMNRSGKRNSLNAELISDLRAAVEAANHDTNVRVIILSGAGASFSAGIDLDYLKTIAQNSPIENAEDSKLLMEMLYAWKTSDKPTIALVEGYALAGGCGLALTCDMIIASDQSKFGFTEVRIGFVPAIVARLLIDRIGKGRSLEILLRGNIITADEAKEKGMINEVVTSGELSFSVQSLAEEIVRSTSPQAIQITKSLLADIDGLDLRSSMIYASKINAFSRTTDDFQRGVNSFLKKEKIVW